MPRVLLILFLTANAVMVAYLETGAGLPDQAVQFLLSKLESGREPERMDKQLGPTNILPRPDLLAAAKGLVKP